LRAGGVRNPQYASTFAFDNDFPALVAEGEHREMREGLLVAETERGVCRVVCFSPRHDVALAGMEAGGIRCVVDAWCEEYSRLGALPFVSYVQIFENRGAMMGASSPHPHSQIWASESLPNEVAKEQRSQAEYLRENGRCLLCDYSRQESGGSRVVFESQGFLVLVPFWAVWPFETLVVSKRHLGAMDKLSESERGDLAAVLKRITGMYDGLFAAPFPYTMGFHGRPTDGETHPEWHFHAHFYPPLLRSATVRKFMVGYEMLGTPQRDFTPEEAALRLRGLKSGASGDERSGL
jgi:UDPglucose--hexose-1-phosphate uridylyltransferase